MKYRNIKTKVGGLTFDSKKEAHRYLELKQLQKEGRISNLELQPLFKLIVNEQLICKYKADFRYKFIPHGKIMKMGAWDVVEDVKGMKTAVYRLKKKLMLACHGIDILET